MATVYKFQVSMPVTDTLSRNRISNTFHLLHVTGGLIDTDLEAMAADVVELWQTQHGSTLKEVNCKVYDVDAVPNYPRAEVVVNVGQVWTQVSPREIALVLSFAGDHRGAKHERGRLYLNPAIAFANFQPGLRPSAGDLAWALGLYETPNASLPDLGGVDWKFGVYSPTYKIFTQSKQAWVNDDWDVQRKRGLRESTRVNSVREG